MRFVLVAVLAVAALPKCGPVQQGPTPLPTSTASVPPPVASGEACSNECASAHKQCPRATLTEAECAESCKAGVENVDNTSAHCQAVMLMCSIKCAP